MTFAEYVREIDNRAATCTRTKDECCRFFYRDEFTRFGVQVHRNGRTPRSRRRSRYQLRIIQRRRAVLLDFCLDPRSGSSALTCEVGETRYDRAWRVLDLHLSCAAACLLMRSTWARDFDAGSIMNRPVRFSLERLGKKHPPSAPALAHAEWTEGGL